MRILVTGAGGFAGSVIADHLYKSGLDAAGTWRNNKPEAEYKLIRVDLSSDIDMDYTPDVIVHTAGALPYKAGSCQEYIHDNIDSMRNIISFAKRSKTKRIINLSTIGIYGEFRNETINEDSDRINPEAYGITKYIAECMLNEEPDIESINIRMPGILGRGARGVWLADTAKKMLRNEDITIYSPDFLTKNFVWIDDLAKFVKVLIESEKWKHNTVVLACEKGATIRNIVEKLKEKTDSCSNIIVGKGDRKPFCLDPSRALEMGYRPLSATEVVDAYSAECML